MMEVNRTPTSERRSPVRLGVIGLGGFGRLHARTIAGLMEAELAALVDVRPVCLAQMSDEVGPVPCFTNIDEAVAASDAEAWVVATSSESHVALTRRLLAAGKQVLLEKPIAQNLADAQSLAPLVRKDSQNLMLGHITLFNSEFQALAREVAGRGRIRLIDAVRHRSADHAVTYAGEDPFHLLMTHDLYQVQVLTAGREPIHLRGRRARNADRTSDLAVAELAWEDGTIARAAASFLTPGALGDQGFERLEIMGDGWGARLRPNPRPLEWWDEKVRWPLALEIGDSAAAPSGMLAQELRCFCRVVRKIENIPIGARYGDALQVMRWLDALVASASNSGDARQT